MALELHVWGPGFSLPSIDPHCLAAIAYLQRAVPEGEWKLVASSNPTLSPTNELPALRNGDVWIGGFRNIFHYIAQISSGEWVLDAGLAEQEGADCIAFSSFVESHGQPLLDLSLYVSSENFTTITRPLYNTIQPFPMPYLTPNSIRAAAKLRTEHLGLSGLDIDIDGTRTQHSIIPESLRTSRTTVSSLLAASPEAHAQIRLDALARNFLEPLRDLLGEKKFFASDRQFSSLDCLVLGYLSLMLIPDLPQRWLSKIMRANFSGLCAWTEELRIGVFGPAVTVEDALLKSPGASASAAEQQIRKNYSLPWAAPQDRGVIGVGQTYLATLANSIPVVGEYRRNIREEQLSQKKTEEEPSSTLQAATIAGGIFASAALLVGYMFQQGILPLGGEEPERQRGNGLNAFGEAGAALSIYANQMDAEVQRQRILEVESHGPPHSQPAMEVEIGSNGTVVKETTG